MGINQQEDIELVNFYNLLLEAERAGVAVLGELVPQIKNHPLQSTLKKFLRDEGLNCRILMSLIYDLDLEPSKRTGDFVSKVRDRKSIVEKVELLIHGQEWVARKIREFRHLLPPGSSYLFIEAIKVQHEENVNSLKKIVNEKDLI
jgi:hypothetical protein